MKFEGNKCGRFKLLRRVLKKSGNVLHRVFKKVGKVRVRSNKIVMTIGNLVVKSNNLTLLKENRESLQLTEVRARGVLKPMNWVKRKGTTGKIEPSLQSLLEEKLPFQ